MSIVGYRPYAVPDEVGGAHVHYIHARRARVGLIQPNTQIIVPALTMAGVGGIFAGVFWGLRGILIGSALGAMFGIASVSVGDASASEIASEKKP